MGGQLIDGPLCSSSPSVYGYNWRDVLVRFVIASIADVVVVFGTSWVAFICLDHGLKPRSAIISANSIVGVSVNRRRKDWHFLDGYATRFHPYAATLGGRFS